MHKTKVTTVAALVAFLAAPASAREWYGVDMDAVPWPTFCASTKAVPVERGGRRCDISHPASALHGRFRDFTGRNQNPPPNCEIAANEYRRLTTAKESSSKPWYECTWAWGVALKDRATEPERFKEPFAAWREQYFRAWRTGGKQ